VRRHPGRAAGGRPRADRGRSERRSRDRQGGAVLVSHLRAQPATSFYLSVGHQPRP